MIKFINKIILEILTILLLLTNICLNTNLYAKTDYLDALNTSINIKDSNELKSKYGLSNDQLDKLAMLNYLSFLSTEIQESKNSKLYLEEVYDLLLNQLNPSTIDEVTNEKIQEMLDVIKSLRMTDVKRERLSYIYEQNKAQALSEAAPSPLTIMNIVQSTDYKKLIVSIAALAIDSYSSYHKYTSETNLKYLKDGWELDDEEYQTICELKEDNFNYMVKIAHQYNIPDKNILSQDDIKEYVEWENNDNNVGRIQFLENNQEKYELYADYWLLLSKSYYNNKNYKKCVSCINTFLSIQPNIFRYNTKLATSLTYVLAALDHVYKGSKLIERKKYYTKILYQKTRNSDYDLRYITALSCIDIANDTENDSKSLYNLAYKIELDNVNNRVQYQKELNATFLKEIALEEVPEGSTADTKKEIKQYNKALKAERKKELAPVDTTLLINTKLMLELASKLNKGKTTKKKINDILHNNGDNLFLTDTLDNKLWYKSKKPNTTYNLLKASLTGKLSIVIPANYVCDKSSIVVSIKRGDKKIKIKNWKVKSVSRKEDYTIDQMKVAYTSQQTKNNSIKNGDTITVTLYPYGKSYKEFFTPIKVKYSVKKSGLICKLVLKK